MEGLLEMQHQVVSVNSMIFKILNMLFKKKNAENEFDQLRKEVFDLEIEQVIKLAFNFLSDENKFNVRWAKKPLNIDLPPLAKSFFDRVESFNQLNGEAKASSNEIGSSEYHFGCIRVAIDSDFTELVLKDRQELVYEVDGSENDFQEAPFPSIYHWVVYSSCVVYPDFGDRLKESNQGARDS